MVECLHDASRWGSKENLEKELVYLDSIVASFIMPYSSAFAYAMGDEDMAHSRHNMNQEYYNALREPRVNPKAFVTEDGEYGIASSNIREGDSVCQFKGSRLGVVLRRKRDYYMLVSRAIFSPGLAQAREELALQQKSFDNVLKVSSHDSASTKEENHHDEAERTVDIFLDAATLQALTRPIKFNDKHKNREPLCIQESSFGWYEFIKFGVLSVDDARLFRALNTSDAS